MNLEDLVETQVSTEDIFKGFILDVKVDKIKQPDGNIGTRELIRHIGAVCIVPITADNKVILENQYRYPIAQVVQEIPAGKLDYKDEDRLEAAKRELREETGYTADEWIDMGLYYPAPAYSDEKITMYLAKGLHKGENDLDDDEFIEVIEVPIEEVIEKIMSGEITDGKTQVAVLKAARLIPTLKPQ